jgi:solute carrier family 35 protein E3
MHRVLASPTRDASDHARDANDERQPMLAVTVLPSEPDAASRAAEQSTGAAGVTSSALATPSPSAIAASAPAPWLTPLAWEVALILVANVVSVVGIVAANKRVYQLGFKLPSTLMTLHFCVTYAFVVCFHRVGYFTAKRIETRQYVKLGLAQVGSVALVNLSLVHNDVGSYQLMKFLVIFVTCALEFVWYRKVYSPAVYAVLVVLVVSISLATITAIHFTLKGLLFGIAGAVATAMYQVVNKYIQTEFSVSPLQLLHYEQPFSAMWCALIAVLTEPVELLFAGSGASAGAADPAGTPAAAALTSSRGVPGFDWTTELALFVLASAVCAFGVNVTCYLIIGKTSPVTYSVVGHVKTVSVFAMGVLFLGDVVSLWQAFWMSAAFCCILLYGHVSAAPNASTQAKPPRAVTTSASSSATTAAIGQADASTMATAATAATASTVAAAVDDDHNK